MKKQELVKLRKLFVEELNRREKINRLLMADDIKKIIGHYSLDDISFLDTSEDIVIREIIKDFYPIETNGIFVCLNGFYNEMKPGCSHYNTIIVDPMDEMAEERTYIDIESEKDYTDYVNCETFSTSFEKRNVVLNPYNTTQNYNGMECVREDFFMYACKYGQPMARKLLLQKYTRM